MAEGVLVLLASKALKSLSKSALKKFASWWGAQDELKELENTIWMIRARVRDAGDHQQVEGNDMIKEWLRRLRFVLYRADDLFDEIFTVDCQAQRMEHSTMAKVGILFSSSDSFRYDRKLGDKIKSISKELEAIMFDMIGLNLRVCLAEELQLSMDRLNKKRKETSFVIIEDIVIGRENDNNLIIEMVLGPTTDNGERLTFIPIVGFRGVGKTTLAQLIYNDESVRRHFDSARWVDGDYNCLRGITENKKYLIVLDDICDKKSDRDLVQFVKDLNCGPGSKVIVTTCSYVVAERVGTVGEVYKLGGLDADNAWNLFKRFAFEPGQEVKEFSFSHVGKELIELCGNVPLAIKVIAGVLCSKESMHEWLLVRDNLRSKANITDREGIMHVLKLSYDYLPPELKQCFAYCSLFPKGYKFDKAKNVNLWMAQGFIETLDKGVGNCYFLELLRRNFFRDPSYDRLTREVVSCEMPDLIHDLADLVAGDESKKFDKSSVLSTDELVHFSVSLPDSYTLVEDVEWEHPPSLLAARKLRTLLFLRDFTSKISCAINESSLERMVSKFKSLRALNLENMGIVMIPDSLGGLKHLRYLNLEGNNMCCIPDATVQLDNLQVLNLSNCEFLEELPRDFPEFANLKTLALDWISLTDLPLGFGKLTSLEEFKEFVVGKGQNTGLNSLPASNLRGELSIKFNKWRENAVIEAQRACLKDNRTLKFLTLDMECDCSEGGVPPAFDELNEMLACLKLPSNLEFFEVKVYNGDQMPCGWFNELCKLVSVKIMWCANCRVLPNFSRLPHLRSLHLDYLEALEYVEDDDDIRVMGSPGRNSYDCYFPSLEVLELCNMPELRGWKRPSEKEDGERQQFFPRLLQMKVYFCGKLVSMPLAPKLEEFDAPNINEALKSMLTSH